MRHLKNKIAKAQESIGLTYSESSDDEDKINVTCDVRQTESESESKKAHECLSPEKKIIKIHKLTEEIESEAPDQKSKPKPKRIRVRNPDLSSSKNIMKNYARAFSTFALSKIAKPYLINIATNYLSSVQSHSRETSAEIASFRMFIKANKAKINCIKQLRMILVPGPEDNVRIAFFKKLFQGICVIFLKFFSVNWLFSSKISDKIAHLKYRHKLLRRVQNPHLFTYLEDFAKK